jgi:hypothetical protein
LDLTTIDDGDMLIFYVNNRSSMPCHMFKGSDCLFFVGSKIIVVTHAFRLTRSLLSSPGVTVFQSGVTGSQLVRRYRKITVVRASTGQNISRIGTWFTDSSASEYQLTSSVKPHGLWRIYLYDTKNLDADTIQNGVLHYSRPQ